MSVHPVEPLADGRLRAGLVTALVLALAVLGSGMAVVYVKYLTRVEFAEVQAARTARDALDVEWGRLQLEEAALTTQTRVEDAARGKLDMHIPQTAEVRIVEVKVGGQGR